ncbi:hypothetical protein [Paenibacillus sp. L3-i20]|uniref:hypothetical protein n=1 Tax=Paenibacillus sp. L3-i20 TaxID=2905833 RepID=UPI001EDFAC67|nr:hypothetical protein [Paenibacillus sp. L3-i20]
MNLLMSLLLVSFRRALFSGRFAISVVGVTLALFLTSYGMISPQSDVLSVVMLYGGGNLILIVGILPLLPFATTFASEWEERAASFWIVRSGVHCYAIAKVFVSAISGILVTFAGITLYALLLLTKLPFFTKSMTGDAYAPLLDANMPLLYFFSSAIHLSLSSALFAVAALWISAFIPNRFTAMAFPAVLYFVIFRLTNFWDIPEFLKLSKIVGETYHAGSPLASFLLKLGTVTVLCLLMGYGSVRQIRRRVQHD